MSAAPRTALWGGRDGEGEEEGARERGGPAEGRGPRESGAGKRGRGAGGTRRTGVPAGMGGGDGLGSRGAELPGAGFRGALAFSSGDSPPTAAPVKPRRGRGRPEGGATLGGSWRSPGNNGEGRIGGGGGSRWEDGAHTPALRRRASERASARGLSVAPELGAGPGGGTGSERPAGRGSRGPARRRRGAARGRQRARGRVHRRAAHVRLPGCGRLC